MKVKHVCAVIWCDTNLYHKVEQWLRLNLCNLEWTTWVIRLYSYLQWKAGKSKSWGDGGSEDVIKVKKKQTVRTPADKMLPSGGKIFNLNFAVKIKLKSIIFLWMKASTQVERFLCSPQEEGQSGVLVFQQEAGRLVHAQNMNQEFLRVVNVN